MASDILIERVHLYGLDSWRFYETGPGMMAHYLLDTGSNLPTTNTVTQGHSLTGIIVSSLPLKERSMDDTGDVLISESQLSPGYSELQ